MFPSYADSPLGRRGMYFWNLTKRVQWADWRSNRNLDSHRWKCGGFLGELGRHEPNRVFHQRSLVSRERSIGSVFNGLIGAQTGTLTATGGNVVVSSVSLGGTNPTEFSISGLSFPVTVTTSQPVLFTVTFTPGATGGGAGTGLVTSNASRSANAATVCR